MGEINELSPEEVRAQLQSPEPPLLLDVREQDEWDICHLEGAVRISLQELPVFAPEVLRLNRRPIIVYCHHGVRSLHGAKWLAANGYGKVSHLAGGIDRWARELDPGMAVY